MTLFTILSPTLYFLIRYLPHCSYCDHNNPDSNKITTNFKKSRVLNKKTWGFKSRKRACSVRYTA